MSLEQDRINMKIMLQNQQMANDEMSYNKLQRNIANKIAREELNEAQELIATNNNINIWSKDLVVLNTLGFGKETSVVVRQEKIDGKKEKYFESVSKIVGYKFKNIGEHTIPYETEEYVYDEKHNRWVSNGIVSKELKPNETISLARKYFVKLASIEEISFEFANGNVLAGAKSKKAQTLDEILEAHYFGFRDKNKDAHSSDIKEEIGIFEDNAWKIREEYESTFGYLNNPKKSNKKVSRQSYSAALLRKKIEQMG